MALLLLFGIIYQIKLNFFYVSLGHELRYSVSSEWERAVC